VKIRPVGVDGARIVWWVTTRDFEFTDRDRLAGLAGEETSHVGRVNTMAYGLFRALRLHRETIQNYRSGRS